MKTKTCSKRSVSVKSTFRLYIDKSNPGHRLVDSIAAKICESETFMKAAVMKVSHKIALEQVTCTLNEYAFKLSTGTNWKIYCCNNGEEIEEYD